MLSSPPGVHRAQVVLDVTTVPGGTLAYLAGDELAVWGENPPQVSGGRGAAQAHVT